MREGIYAIWGCVLRERERVHIEGMGLNQIFFNIIKRRRFDKQNGIVLNTPRALQKIPTP